MESIFDFETTEEAVTEETLTAWSDSVADLFLQQGNPYCLKRAELIKVIPRNAVHKLLEAGRLEISRNSTPETPYYMLPKELRTFYDLDAALDELDLRLHQALIVEQKAWRPVANEILLGHSRCFPVTSTMLNHEMTEEEKKTTEDYRKGQLKLEKKYAMQLGLEHFLSVEESRGMKMGGFKDAFARNETLPRIASDLIPMKEFDEVKDYFTRHAFFVGVGDYCPYPQYRTFMPGPLEIAALAGAEDLKTIELILSYAGGGFSDKNRTVIYPDGWSYERYQNSLTADDFLAIAEDIARLERLRTGA